MNKFVGLSASSVHKTYMSPMFNDLEDKAWFTLATETEAETETEARNPIQTL